MKKIKGILLVLLTLSLVLFVALPAMAIDPVEPSDTLEVCLKTDGRYSNAAYLHIGRDGGPSRRGGYLLFRY